MKFSLIIETTVIAIRSIPIRKVIGHLVMWTPVIVLLICSGIFVTWWIPLIAIAGIGIVGGFVLAGLCILRE